MYREDVLVRMSGKSKFILVLALIALVYFVVSGGESVSIGMNVPSDTLAKKDIVKVEDRELSQSEVDVLAVISPEATINIIREYEVVEKQRIERPESVDGVLACPNRNCITSGDEPIRTRFAVLDEGLRCHYCGEIIREAEITDHLTVA